MKFKTSFLLLTNSHHFCQPFGGENVVLQMQDILALNKLVSKTSIP